MQPPTNNAAGVFGGDWKLVLESVGRADAGVINLVRQIAHGSDRELAELVYQAPSQLLDNLQLGAANEIAGLLVSAGLKVRVAGPDADVVPGRGDFELGLVIANVAALPSVIRGAAALLGCGVDIAQRVVCATPAVLLSQVSAATVEAVRERFAPFGVTLDVSRISQARYSATVAVPAPGVRATLRKLVQEALPEEKIAEGRDGLLLTDLDHDAVELLAARLQRTGARFSCCNLELERCDVRLQQAKDSEAMRAKLVELGIPARVASTVLHRLPVVVQQNVPLQQATRLLAEFAELGARATAIPYSSQRFALALSVVADRRAAVQTLVSVGQLQETDAVVAVHEGHGTLVGSFSRTTALWLRSLLAAQGARVSVELR